MTKNQFISIFLMALTGVLLVLFFSRPPLEESANPGLISVLTAVLFAWMGIAWFMSWYLFWRALGEFNHD